MQESKEKTGKDYNTKAKKRHYVKIKYFKN